MPTIRRCCIVGCQSNSRDQPQLQFFQFPRPENPFHKVWKQACQASLSRILPFKKPVVCAYHFGPNCIGGRRLVGNAIPTIRLEVPSNLKASEHQAMLQEIERSRKCAYINAVVYEWLVRANLNPQLRGSITHGMIKEKAENARQIIGSDTFVADNRWLNRFRETHLINFSQKLSANQLKPLGPSLWIPEIVQDLQSMYPPATPERMTNLENVPEQYINYMHQYGEHAEDDEQDSMDQSYQDSPYEQKPQIMNGNSYQPQQRHSLNGSPYQQAVNGSGYQQQQLNGSSYQQQQQRSSNQYEDFYERSPNNNMSGNGNGLAPPPQRPLSQPRPLSVSPTQTNGTPNRQSPFAQLAKRLKTQNDDEEPSNGADSQTSASSPAQEPIEDLTDGPELGNNNVKSPTGNGCSTPSSSQSPAPSLNGKISSNGLKTSLSPCKELRSYNQALEYLKPLEEFALFKENFRAIGLISQLEMILQKGGKTVVAEN